MKEGIEKYSLLFYHGLNGGTTRSESTHLVKETGIMTENVLHLKAPGNWLNDPNGFIYYQGKYHLFYQHFPYAPRWGTMHWGHAVSEDLIHWKHLGIALFPTKSYDRNGIFSGSAIEKDEKLFLYYSAVRYLEEEDENIHNAPGDRYESSQAMITSEDGFHFDNWEDKRQVIPVIREEAAGDSTHTRDPKVWKDGDCYYMVLGSTCRGNAARILFYRSRDAVNWEYVNQCQDKRYGKMMECPDLFQVGEDCVFIGSPMFLTEDGLEYSSHTVCALADYDADKCRLSLPGRYQFVDYGMDLYAAQTNTDREGRRVMIAWMRMPRTVEAPGEKPWNGMMCLPRVVEVEEGHIYFRVHPAVDAYFDEELPSVESLLEKGPLGRSVCRLKAELHPAERLDIGGYKIWIEEDSVKTDRSEVFDNIEGYRVGGSTPGLSGKYELDIFIDSNLIEIFVNGGQYVLSHVVYGLKRYIRGRVEQIYVSSEVR